MCGYQEGAAARGNVFFNVDINAVLINSSVAACVSQPVRQTIAALMCVVRIVHHCICFSRQASCLVQATPRHRASACSATDGAGDDVADGCIRGIQAPRFC